MPMQIDPSKLAAGAVLGARRLCHSRRETAFSPESTAGSSEAELNLIEVFSAHLGRGVLGARSYRTKTR